MNYGFYGSGAAGRTNYLEHPLLDEPLQVQNDWDRLDPVGYPARLL